MKNTETETTEKLNFTLLEQEVEEKEEESEQEEF